MVSWLANQSPKLVLSVSMKWASTQRFCTVRYLYPMPWSHRAFQQNSFQCPNSICAKCEVSDSKNGAIKSKNMTLIDGFKSSFKETTGEFWKTVELQDFLKFLENHQFLLPPEKSRPRSDANALLRMGLIILVLGKVYVTWEIRQLENWHFQFVKKANLKVVLSGCHCSLLSTRSYTICATFAWSRAYTTAPSYRSIHF